MSFELYVETYRGNVRDTTYLGWIKLVILVQLNIIYLG